MQNRNHTHTGNCQACGRSQAIGINTGRVAKHGYTVERGGWGFVGVCPGSDKSPAQFTVEFTHAIIKRCTEAAASHDEAADALEAGTRRPLMADHYDADLEYVNEYNRKHKGKWVEISFDIATNEEQRATIRKAIGMNRQEAAGNRSHAAMLTSFVLPLFGTPLESVEQAEVRKAQAKAAKGPTKQSFKDRLDRINRDFDKAIDKVRDMLLALDRDTRHAAWNAAYDMPMYPHEFRARHSTAILAVFPDAVDAVKELEQMVAARNAIKAEQKAAGL